MAIDKSLVDDILKKTNIVNVISSYINVIKKGRNHVALCPFHDDKNPSLQISSDKQIFKCFVCNTGGNAIQFVEKYERINFFAALKKVADISGIIDERFNEQFKQQSQTNPEFEQLYRLMEDVLEFYKFSLTTEEGAVAQQYLIDRGITEQLQKRFSIGYSLANSPMMLQFLQSKGHSRTLLEEQGIISKTSTGVDRLAGRVIFPIFNHHGRVVAFSGRLIVKSDEPKYINSPESKIFFKNQVLYNYHQVKLSASKDQYVYVLEGFMDVIALSSIGIESSVAIMGTAFSKNHLSLLRMLKSEIRVCLDGDDAGQAAMIKMIPILDQASLNYQFVDSSNEMRDPDDILRKDGPDALKKYLQTLVNRSEFALNYYQRRKKLKSSQERDEFVRLMIPIIATSKSDLQTEHFTRRLAQISSFQINTIAKLISDYRLNKMDNANLFEKFRPEAAILKKFKGAERQLLYFMLNDARAIDFYKKRIEFFFDDIYRTIANFIIERSSQAQTTDLTSLLSDINATEIDKKEVIINEMTSIALDKNYPQCSEQLLEEIDGVISKERIKFQLKQQLSEALKGKSDSEKARIYTEFQKKLLALDKPYKKGE